MLKRAHKGVCHKLSAKHLQRYANEFAGRQNIRDKDTIDYGPRTSRGHPDRPQLPLPPLAIPCMSTIVYNPHYTVHLGNRS